MMFTVWKDAETHPLIIIQEFEIFSEMMISEYVFMYFQIWKYFF